MSVHILGIGAMGMLLAHEVFLAGLKPVLLVKHHAVQQHLQALNNSMTLARHRDSGVSYHTTKMAVRQKPTASARGLEISDLVVATKTYSTKEALAPYMPYITPKTNLVFLQNGMGVVPNAVEELWHGRSLPRLFHIISTHGAYKERVNLTHHVGQGSLTIAEIPWRTGSVAGLDAGLAPSNLPEVIEALLRSLNLNTSVAPYPEFLVTQMEKLVVNACINPISALMDCRNGDLLHSTHCISMMKKVISECVECFKTDSNVFSVVPEASTILSRERLLQCVLDVCQKTSENSSSMREDLRDGKMTEIDAINGHIVQLGAKTGVATPLNKTFCTMVSARHQIARVKENPMLAGAFGSY
ncbi:2-dehydropantoate 2-reductase [Metschnikowia bicuspidata]|uniref:2-dehydropantoate 2-reductase n=1 Tax=Metschnikowia bicuspidata TaxID=27322 RepID=A0A4P9ZER5_9ASCO|nr:2-dehydropantoate 2-reductase [Metschnikowia bicuspidata]